MKRGHRPTDLSNEQYEQAIIECLGVTKNIAEKLGITDQAVDKKLRTNPYLRDLMETVRREKLWAYTFEGWMEALQNKEKWAIVKGLEYVGHYLGYFKSQEITMQKGNKHDLSQISDENLDKINELLGGDEEVEINEFTDNANENGSTSGEIEA